MNWTHKRNCVSCISGRLYQISFWPRGLNCSNQNNPIPLVIIRFKQASAVLWIRHTTLCRQVSCSIWAPGTLGNLWYLEEISKKALEDLCDATRVNKYEHCYIGSMNESSDIYRVSQNLGFVENCHWGPLGWARVKSWPIFEKFRKFSIW